MIPMANTKFSSAQKPPGSSLFPIPPVPGQPVQTVADRYVPRERYAKIFGVPKLWSGQRWVHLVHNWRTGGSSLTALLSVNFHDSYLKVGHPFTRDGWPVDYSQHPLQITKAHQLREWIDVQPSPGILAGHTYAGMAANLGVKNVDLWLTLREPAARLNSGLLRFHRKALKNDHPDGGYVGHTKGYAFQSAQEIESVCRENLAHEINGMCRRIAGYSMLHSASLPHSEDDLESCRELDERPVDQACFDIAMDHLRSSRWIYLTDHVIPSLMLLEHEYGLNPLIHPCSDLVHNPQWNGSGITRLQESLLLKHRSLLENLNSWDLKLYKEATMLFWKRWREADIDPNRLKARRILQGRPLLNAGLFVNPSIDLDQILGKITLLATRSTSSAVARWIKNDGRAASFWA